MKKNFIYLLLFFSLIAQAQVTPSYPTIKLTKTVEGVKQDSLLVLGTDKTVKHIPYSKISNVQEYATASALPVTGVAGKLYITKDNNKIYRWNGTFYDQLAVTDISGKVDKNSPITAGTATKIVYDSKGLVIGGSSANVADITGLQAALDLKINNSEKGVTVATLVDGKVPNSQIPALAISETFTVTSQSEMLALSQAEQGDVAIRSDISKSFILRQSPSSVLGNWSELLTPTSAVTTVFGRNGAVTAKSGDYSADQVTETATRKFQTPTQSAYNDATGSIQGQLNGKENAFSKNTAFNKNFGTAAGTVAEGNDSRILAVSTHTHGLGRHNLNAPAFIDGLTSSNFRDILFGSSAISDNISTSRWNNVPSALSGLAQFGNMLAWSGNDTHAFIATNHNSPKVRVGGGLNNGINWSKDLAFSDGTGATGTWGINISGNATSASNSTLWNGFSFNGSFQPVVGGLLSYDGGSSATLSNLGQVRSWLGLGSNAYNSTDYFKYETFTADANTLPGNRSAFTYAINAPHTGTLVHFGAVGYGTQINTNSSNGDSFSFRTSNGDILAWNPWRKMWHDGNFNPANYLPLSGGNISGSVGIGTTTPNRKLEVADTDSQFSLKGTISGAPVYQTWYNSSNVRRGYFGFASESNSDIRLVNEEVGNIYISPNNGSTIVSSTVTATGFFQSSDLRLKNILRRDGDIAYFTWKDGRDTKEHIGYVAQEVQENHPNQVQADEKGILSVNYVEILVEKIRVLEKRIEQLEKSK